MDGCKTIVEFHVHASFHIFSYQIIFPTPIIVLYMDMLWDK